MDYRCPHCGAWLHRPDRCAVRDTDNPVAVSTDCPECRQPYEITMTEFGYYQVRRPAQVDHNHPDRWMGPKFKRPNWAHRPTEAAKINDRPLRD